MSADFIHLHVHSHFSLLNALPKIPTLVEAAKKDGQTALALTDDGNLYGAIEFYKTCTNEGIKPIIGVDFFVAPRTRHDKEHRIDNYTSRLVLLAQNKKGYDNLIKLVTYSFTEGFYYHPRVDEELIEKYSDDLIAILPSFSAPTSKGLRDNDHRKTSEILEWYKKVFGDNLYLEITHHPEIADHSELQEKVVELGKTNNVPLVAAHDVYYMKKEDNIARELARKIQSGTTLMGDEVDRPEDFSFINQKTAQMYFKKYPEALENSVKIAAQCNLELTLGEWIFPEYPKEKGKTYNQMLLEAIEKGLEMRGLEKTDKIQNRIDHEMNIISDKNFSPYFLVVSDLLLKAKEMGIYTNTRGSAAGSLISYLTGITTVNPLDYNLPFERFLNPERPSAPDIDMDIADNRRDDLIEYVREKYGIDHVAQIGTFGTMMARAVVRDVARALGHSYNVGDRIAKLIPFGAQGFPMTIERALEMEPELKQAYKEDSETKEIIDLAKKLEGNARHIGVHAAGVVIAPQPVIEYAPLQPDPRGGKMITQYNMYSIADEYGGVGLLKFDFLGLKNLAVLADSIKRVKKIHGKEIDADNMPLDDEKTFKMLSDGHTMGVFQMASAGMTRYLMELKPTTIHDINAMVALYRPGPMEFIPDYIARKRDPSKVKYIDSRMEKYLKPTFGILIYQDDVMSIAVELAGYSWGEADKFRKAMGKKIPELMAEQKDKFFRGCLEGGMNDKSAQQLWDMIETFAAYGFNKSHSVSYGNLAYKTAYMKANYPLEFMSSLLTADSGNIDTISEIIEECKAMNIEILPPDVNESYEVFAVVPNERQIRFGLDSIKNFGTNVSHQIVEERKANGPYKDITDFLERVRSSGMNRRGLESLIQSGALDRFASRGRLLKNIEILLEFQKEMNKKPEGQDSLFGLSESSSALTLFDAKDVSQKQKLAWEKELLGLYVSGHPLEAYAKKLEGRPGISDVKTKQREGMVTVIAGIISENKTILTKNGEKMSFIRIADLEDSIEAVAFPRVLTEHGELLGIDTCVLLKGRISNRNDEKSFIIEAVRAL
ncbi:DNA polymerase III subunit alpha [bacterium]|nr:DNA polymerase III subunit alpha [bacterium]|tara:strand:- start:3612 stop:6779 length:3168 start_codon:yes stop_codon:yes gene_type:complete